MLVATGSPSCRSSTCATNEVAARLALPGPSRAVAVSRDGERGFVAAGGDIVAVDVNARTELARASLGPPEISDIELSPVGTTLYVVHGRRLAVARPADARRCAARSRSTATATRIAIDRLGRRGGGRARERPRRDGVARRATLLLRHVKLKGAIGVAIDAGGRTLVTARERLRDDRARPAPRRASAR